MQETWSWPLIQEDPTCHGTTQPMGHTYPACALEPQLLRPHASATEADIP